MNVISPITLTLLIAITTIECVASEDPALTDTLTQIETLTEQSPDKARLLLEQISDQIPSGVTMPALWASKLYCQQDMALGYYKQALERVEPQIALFDALADSPLYGELLICNGLALEFTGDIDTAGKIYQQAITLAEKLQDRKLLSTAYRTRGDLNAYHNTVESALKDLQMAYRLAESADDIDQLNEAKNSLANLYLYIKDYPNALTYYQQVYQTAKEKNRLIEVAVVTFNLARVYRALEQSAQAEKFYLESYQISEQVGDIAGVVYALRGMGTIAFDNQQFELAKNRFEQARTLFGDLGDLMQVAQTNMMLGTIYQQTGEPSKSIAAFRAAISFYETKQSLFNLSNGYQSLAEAYSLMGDYQNAFLAHKDHLKYYQLHYQQDQDKKIAELRVTFDSESTEKENQLLASQNRLTQLELDKQTQVAKFQRWLILLGGLLLVLLIGQIVKHLRTKKQLQRLANTDELTQLSNRRHIIGFAEKVFELASRGNSSLALVMFDIDYFKAFNDQFGHKIGDKVLQLVAQTCTPLLRKSDILGRIGGEEFLIFLPQTSEQEAVQVAERCRLAIAAIRASFMSDTTTITISSGVATYQEKFNTLDEMLNAADMALYQAKAGGRNQTCIAAVH